MEVWMYAGESVRMREEGESEEGEVRLGVTCAKEIRLRHFILTDRPREGSAKPPETLSLSLLPPSLCRSYPYFLSTVTLALSLSIIPLSLCHLLLFTVSTFIVYFVFSLQHTCSFTASLLVRTFPFVSLCSKSFLFHFQKS